MTIVALDQHAYSLDEVQRAFSNGDLEGVLARTRTASTTLHAVLRARAQLRRQLPSDALSTAEAGRVHDGSLGERIELELIRSTALSRLGRFPEAESAIATARAFALGSLDTTIERDVLVHHATSYLMRNDFESASVLLEQAFGLPKPRPMSIDANRICDAQHVLARAFELTSFIAAAEGDFPSQIRAITQAFQYATESSTRDLLLEANLAATCCIYAAELGRTDLIESIRLWTAKVTWTRDMDLQRFYISRMGAIADALSGDELSAHRHLTIAAQFAPTKEYGLMLMLDRLNLTRRLHGTTPQYLGELGGIVDIAGRIDWLASASKNDGYVVLRMIAEALAASDPDQAELLLGQYQRCFTLSARNQGVHYTRRPKAAELFVTGLIAATRGRDAEARKAFDSAHELFVEAHCPWRAAIVAVERFALDRNASRVDHDVIDRFSDAWFAKRFTELLAA